MAKIYDLPLRYFIPKLWVNHSFKRFFRPYIVLGEENIPRDQPFIFAANHLNALMDALAMLAIMPWRHSIVFLARADMFRNPTAAYWLDYVKIMPAFRIRDGRENMTNNNDTFEKAEEVLLSGNSIGILPEGNQGSERKMRPLQKGIFRIAFSAQEKNADKKIKIVPVGLDYGDFIKYGRHLIINIGKPIEISEYMSEYTENAPATMNVVKDRLATDLHNLTLDLATEKYYPEFETVAFLLDKYACRQKGDLSTVKNRFFARQRISEKLCATEQNQPEKMQQIAEKCDELEKNLKVLNLKRWVLTCKPLSVWKNLSESLVLIATAPLFIIGFILNFLPFFAPVWIRKYILKAKNPLFYSSLHCGFSIISYPLFYLIQLLIVGLCISWNPWVLLGSLVLFSLSSRPAYIWYRLMRKWMAMNRYSHLLHKKNAQLQQCTETYTMLKNWFDGK